MKCKSCKRWIGENEPRAICTCGDVYCHTCISLFSPKELEQVLKDAEAQGHKVTI